MPAARFRLGLAALTALAAAAGATHAHAQASEDQVKAAFLPKFVRYVEMPAAAQPVDSQPYYLCVIGRDPFGPMLDRAAANETIGGHPIAVRRFPGTEAPAVGGCHVAYLAGANEAQTVQMVSATRRRPMITVTDSRWGKARGMIHFVIVDGRVRFHIDSGDASTRGLAVSSRLLALAVEVKPR